MPERKRFFLLMSSLRDFGHWLRKEITIKVLVAGNQQMGGTPRCGAPSLAWEWNALAKRGAGGIPSRKKGGGDICRQKRPRTMKCNGIMEWQGRSCVMSLKVGLSLSKCFTHEQQNKMYVLFEPGFNSESFVSGFSPTISILSELRYCFTVH